jgi:hypothetical protein
MASATAEVKDADGKRRPPFHALKAQRKLASYEVAGKADEEIIRPGRDDGKIRRRWTPTEGASSASRF